ncbi:tail fiber assembly protein [Photorhabdus sp. P32]|uniref:tail fiber assembly protein n=1 Tax=Photorhabdus sp. P32 TaxID=3117549 RepID=UPI00311ADD6D
MIYSYYRDKRNEVHAYSEEQLNTVTRLTELELLIAEKEPIYLDAQNKLLQKEAGLNLLIEQRHSLNETSENDINTLNQKIELATEEYDETLQFFNQIEEESQPIKAEYDALLPVFFDIRENLKVMKKMTVREVDAHLNPPISKEQLMAEAEQQKQSLLAEANNAIAPLQYAVDLEMATDGEQASLIAWKKYCVLLNRVDVNQAPDVEWPEVPK